MAIPMEAAFSVRMIAANEEAAMAGGARRHRSERNPMRSFGERLRQAFRMPEEESRAEDLARMAEAIDARRDHARRRAAPSGSPRTPGRASCRTPGREQD